jgi:hypothetical protein
LFRKFLTLSLWKNSILNAVNEFSFCISYGRGSSLRDPASKAYEQALAPYHGWAIRKAVSAGLYVLPTKEQLLKKLNEDGECRFTLHSHLLKFNLEFYLFI